MSSRLDSVGLHRNDTCIAECCSCTIRLLLPEADDKGEGYRANHEYICHMFEKCVSLPVPKGIVSETPLAASLMVNDCEKLGFSASEREWLSCNSYNIALGWASASLNQEALRLLTVCIQV